jgi:CO dehydrogenase nickel-insertion accessory protein CooC1
MEHLSRRTTRDVQHLLIVTDPTQRASSPPNASQVRKELDIHIDNSYLILNDMNGAVPRRCKAHQTTRYSTVGCGAAMTRRKSMNSAHDRW